MASGSVSHSGSPTVGATDGRPTDGRPATRSSWAANVIIGASRAIGDSVALTEQIGARAGVTVLIVGETGTGKELFARGVHACSANLGEPFVAINCAALPDTLLESELFGHEAGAFTDARTRRKGLLEVAGRGTLFLDEIGDLSPKLQPKLLRVLEQRTFRRLGGTDELPLNARIVAGTNASLEDAVDAGAFRADLFYRLNIARLDLPPLRDRGNDVEVLARFFVTQHATEHNRASLQLSSEAVDALKGHSWPGNVRELKNVIERAIIVCEGDVITARHLMFQRRRMVQGAQELPNTIHIPADGKTLEAIVHEAIQLTLGLTQGNLSATARVLGISRPTLARKMREAGFVRRNTLTIS